MEQLQEKSTPLMQQYFAIKHDYADTLLLFQVGDFYELFFDDAKRAAAYLAIALTKRGKHQGADIPLCGIPVHALNHYLTKLIKGGFCVAICDQLSKPQPGTVVDRGVTRVFTPATLTDTAMLDEKSASYLLSFYPGQHQWGLIFGELLTAQLFATTLPVDAMRMLESELTRFFPDEIILPNTQASQPFQRHFKKLGYYANIINTPEQLNQDQVGTPIATALLRSTSSEGQALLRSTSGVYPELCRREEQAWVQQVCHKVQPSVDASPVITDGLQSLYWHLKRTQAAALPQFKHIQLYQPDDYLVLDSATQRNLEIVKNNQDNSIKHTLFATLDHAKTAMGSRTIKKWLQRPLMQQTAIAQRHDVIAILCKQVALLQKLSLLLGGLADIERIIGRIALQRALIGDYIALNDSLTIVPNIKELLQTELTTPLAHALQERMADFSGLTQLLTCSINPDASSSHPIKPGYDYQLDKLKGLLGNGKQELLKLEQQEIAKTGINSLKVGYNQVTGYYIEITNVHAEKVPADYKHLQTLANRKRFVTPELKTLEHNLFRAENELDAVEAEVFNKVKKEVEGYLTPLRHLAQSLAYLDALFGFATAAYEYRYTMPTFNTSHSITIKDGRHPIIEQALDTAFVPNDTFLNDTQSTLVITGPNMGGKSTYLRQTALISIMAQAGSFVPAQQADLSILDRIFTRIGSGDNLAEGKSTFLVEMEETATICSQATKNSLVILDEVGRGTSTYDGIALAQAILEYLHQQVKARCLFATHYHELTALEKPGNAIVNYHAACKQDNNAIIFFHKVVPGIAHGSFGIEVARLAQLPDAIIKRAGSILQTLGSSSGQQPALSFDRASSFAKATADRQDKLHSKSEVGQALPFDRAQDKLRLESEVEAQSSSCQHDAMIENLQAQLANHQAIATKLQAIDCNTLSPKQAFDIIWELVNRA